MSEDDDLGFLTPRDSQQSLTVVQSEGGSRFDRLQFRMREWAAHLVKEVGNDEMDRVSLYFTQDSGYSFDKHTILMSESIGNLFSATEWKLFKYGAIYTEISLNPALSLNDLGIIFPAKFELRRVPDSTHFVNFVVLRENAPEVCSSVNVAQDEQMRELILESGLDEAEYGVIHVPTKTSIDLLSYGSRYLPLAGATLMIVHRSSPSFIRSCRSCV